MLYILLKSYLKVPVQHCREKHRSLQKLMSSEFNKATFRYKGGD